jgi:adenylate cyclase
VSATLHVKAGSQEQTFDCGVLVAIGRVAANDLVLSDPKISRHHALLRIQSDGKYYLMDLGSANGTYVNGNRLLLPHVLKDADEIKVGDHVLVFRQEEPADGSDGDVEPATGASTMLTIGAVMQNMTIAVADIRDYTGFSESVSVDLLAAVLGRWFRRVNEIVEQNGGVVDKFIGDAVMLRWLTSNRDPAESIRSALKTAHEMHLESRALRRRFPQLPHPLRIGVGINTGHAMLGTMGSSKRDYTALGDSVNVAFRLEEATKTLKADVVIGHDSYKHLPEAMWQGHESSVKVKGKRKPLEVCALTFDQLAEILA